MIIIALELVFTSAVAGFSSHPKAFNQTKKQMYNVLGIHKIAQVDESATPPPDSPTTPTDNSTPADIQPTPQPSGDIPSSSPTDATSPIDSSNPAPSDQSTTGDQPLVQESPISSDNPSLFDQQINPATSTQESPTPSDQISPGAANSATLTGDTSNISQTTAVLNPSDTNSPDNLNNQSIDEVKKEDNQLAQTTDLTDQNKLLISFATDKVKNMTNFTKSDDFASTTFAAQRFNDQVDQAISNLSKLSPKEQSQAKVRLTNFCNQADSVIRSVQLSVPEGSEQDLEMARGQCQELQL